MDQKRFVLAMVLSAGVLILWQMFFAPTPPSSKKGADKKASEKQTAQKGATDAEGDEADSTADEDSGTSDDGTGESADGTSTNKGDGGSRQKGDGDETALGKPAMESADEQREVPTETYTMTSDRLRVVATNAGTGQIHSIEIRQPEQYSKRGDLLGKFPDKTDKLPFGVDFVDDQLPIPRGATFEFAEEASERGDDDSFQKLTFRYEDPKGRFAVDKVFSLVDEKPYTLAMDLQIHNRLDDNKLEDTVAVDMFGYRNPDRETSMLNFRPNTTEGVCRMGPEVKRSQITSIESALEYDGSDVEWAAIDTRYFMWALIPDEPGASCGIEKVGEGFLRTRLTHRSFSVLPGESHTLEHTVFLGPKDVDFLGGVHDTLTDSIDYGLFAFIAWPLRSSLDFLYNYVGNWGLAIIILTILIKLLTWPINMKAYRSMNKMKEIQPQLEEIRDKYEDDRQRMTEETMKLFRENDVSPMGGCLPMLLQMPILYGLYIMIFNSVELYEAEFALWYTNLAAPDPFYVLPVVMGVVMYLQQNMMGAGGTNTQAKIMTKVMPVIFTAFMLFLPSGLVLYYSINLIIGLGQQVYIRGFSFGEDSDGSS